MDLRYLKGIKTRYDKQRKVMLHIFAEWHRNKRKELGYTQSELALKMNITFYTLREYEQEKYLPEDVFEYMARMDQLSGKLKRKGRGQAV